MKKKIYKILACSLALITAVAFTGCGSKDESKGDDNKIVIGVSPTPHEEIIKHLMPEFEKEGLKVEVKVFDDYVQPNIALHAKDLDANYFQHKPYLDQFNIDHDENNVELTAVHLEPLGFYSTKVKKLDELKSGDEILIPSDPTNGARALILLDDNGLIKLADKTNLKATADDIVSNPKNIKFTHVDAATIPRAYTDVAGAVINSNYILSSGIDPNSVIVKEKGEGNPYANIVAVRSGDEKLDKFKKFKKVLNSKEAKKFIEENYKGVVVPAFN